MPSRVPLAFTRHELAGAFGDLGTDLPLLVGVVLATGMDATTAFVVFGVLQILSGLVYRLPMPVQPLKAMAAIAIAGALGQDEIVELLTENLNEEEEAGRKVQEQMEPLLEEASGEGEEDEEEGEEDLSSSRGRSGASAPKKSAKSSKSSSRSSGSSRGSRGR